MPVEADAERWATQLATAHQVELASITWAAGAGGIARMTDTGAQLVLAHEILVDDATMRFHVAHEIGHVVLGHARSRRQQLRSAAPYLVAGGAVELATIVSAAFWRWSIALLPIVFVATLAVIARRVVLPRERQADSFAAANGAPAWLARPPATGRGPLAKLIKTHPTWAERSTCG
ncbi:peptidase M48-like protein [Branchiibius hedensis]|uniref:Peptidase family M48 n=1 Tax=Branchiibius hedensis TaxID=672460 RepID=A0A2Y9CAW5_9MICO|nr:M48 family metalloprotease [Branchiibius hedensis]PWJ23297.1 peptidase M48-like protein [Branchiibius hedensis]SSA58986.1 Peptidase family M48 [Branchiibius hedensis]